MGYVGLSYAAGTVRRAVLVLALAAVVAAAAWLLSRSATSDLDLAARPQTVFSTIPLEVGSTYTVGGFRISDDVPRPVRVTSVRVVATIGVEMVGVLAGTRSDAGIGLIARWPPEGYADSLVPGVSFPGTLEIVVGLRTTAAQSGMRGVDVQWVDGGGAQGRRIFDVAAVTCAPGTCTIPEDDIDGYLRQLGLEK